MAYAHGWVTGAFLAPGREPVYVLPRMFVRFHLDGRPPAGTIVVEDDGDGRAAFAAAVGELGSPTRIALGQRAWAETAVELLAACPMHGFRRAAHSSTSSGASRHLPSSS